MTSPVFFRLVSVIHLTVRISDGLVTNKFISLAGCPSECSNSVLCSPQSCPLHCCKRDENDYIDDDELIQ